MDPTDDNVAFSRRLKQALKRSDKKISSPSELALQFNLRHRGTQITNQAAQKWMTGANRPTPDKIVTLAVLLNVSAQWLRYGIPEIHVSNRQSLLLNADARGKCSPTPEEFQLLLRIRRMPEHQRTLILDIVEQFALQQEMWRT